MSDRGKMNPGLTQGEKPKPKKDKKLKAKGGMSKKSFKNVADAEDAKAKKKNAVFYMA
jgi:hypothetical protein